MTSRFTPAPLTGGGIYFSRRGASWNSAPAGPLTGPRLAPNRSAGGSPASTSLALRSAPPILFPGALLPLETRAGGPAPAPGPLSR